MSFIGTAAALRQDSFNKKLIVLSQRILKEIGQALTVKSFSDYNVPLYNGDIEANQGIPQGAQQFIEDLKNHQGLILSCPEYNFSIPGILKNLIDWASRAKPNPFYRRHILLLAASPSLVGGHRGLWQTRIPLEGLGAHVFPDMFCLASAHQAFDQDGNLINTELQQRLQQLLIEFVAFSKK